MGRTGGLGVERIVAAAIDLADREGLDAVSMRKVAEALGSGTMSLYRHVATKDALVTAMVDAVTAAYAYPDATHEDWRERLRILGRTDWAMYLAHPWMIEATAKPVASPATGAAMEWALTAIEDLGLPIEVAAGAVLTVSTYVQGSARMAVSVPGGGNLGAAWVAVVSETPLNESPRLASLAAAIPDMHAEEIMSKGLELIIDGIAARVAGTRS